MRNNLKVNLEIVDLSPWPTSTLAFACFVMDRLKRGRVSVLQRCRHLKIRPKSVPLFVFRSVHWTHDTRRCTSAPLILTHALHTIYCHTLSRVGAPLHINAVNTCARSARRRRPHQNHEATFLRDVTPSILILPS